MPKSYLRFVLALTLAALAPLLNAQVGQNVPTTSGASVKVSDISAGLSAAARGLTSNYSVTSQAVTASTRTYLTGSAITVPLSKLAIGTTLRWRFNITKTAAGSSTSTVDVAIGTAGTTADTAVLSFTKPAGTAAVDEGWCEIECVVRGPLSASGILVGEFRLIHNLASTGHAAIPCVVVNTVSSAFDVTANGLILGVCLTTGASDAITVQQVTAMSSNW